MEEEKVMCPWCGKAISRNKIARHLSTTCKSKPANLTKREIIDVTVVCLYGEVIDNIIHDYENFFSLPDLSEKYGITYYLSQKLLSEHGIKLRGISESAKQITSKKIKNTCLETYGVSNPSQLDFVKDRKKETFIKHYGVDNIWKTEEYKDFTRNRWNDYDDKEKTRILNGIIDKHRNGEISKLEKRILSVLKDMGVGFETQFKIGKYFHKYDIRLSGTKILFEINGDFWHANPNVYCAEDILNFSKTNHPKAKEIWKKDEKNRNVAEANGYKIIYLWENEIRKKTDTEIGKLILDKINS